MKSVPQNMIKVLLVEDSEDYAAIFSTMLKKHDSLFSVKLVIRLQEALDYLKQEAADVVVLDLGLPDSRGLETLEKFRKEYPKIPIVIMTGQDLTEHGIEVIRQGAQDYLPKQELSSGDLARILRYAVERKRAEELLNKKYLEVKLLYEITAIAGTREMTFEEGLTKCLNLICETINWPVGHIFLYNEDQELLRSSRIWYVKNSKAHVLFQEFSQKMEFKPGIGLAGMAYKQGKPVWYNSVHSDVNFFRQVLCQELGLKTAFGFPVKISGKVVAVFEFFHENVIGEDADMICLLEGIGEQVGRILERQAAQQALQASELQYRCIFESVADGVFIFEPGGAISEVNPAACKMFGYKKEELLGRKVAEIFHPEDFERSSFILQQIAEGQHFFSESLHRRKDGTRFYGEIRGSRVVYFGKSRSMMVVRDVTERKFAEMELDQQRERSLYQKKMAALGEMAGGVAHEVNTPLGVVVGKAGQLRDVLEAKPINVTLAKRLAGEIELMGMKIAKIVKGLRSFSRDSAKDAMEDIPLKNVIEDTLSLCTEKFRNHDIELITAPFSADLTIKCRNTEMCQVLLNLLSNAHDAAEPLSERWVRLSFREVDGHVDICVTDSGNGIPENIREKIFSPFFTTKEVGRGTGLGLSISKGIVEAHGGRLFLDESAVNTSFVVRLPKPVVKEPLRKAS